MLKKFALITMLSASAFAMNSAELNINNTDLEASAKLDLGQINQNVEPNTTFIGFRVVDADDAHSSDNGHKNKPYYEANFLMKEPLANTGFSVGMGVKFNYTSDFSSIPLGLEGTYKIPTTTLVPMYVNTSFYYGPKVLSFSN